MRNSTIHSLIHNKNVDFLLSLARSFLHFIWLWEFFFVKEFFFFLPSASSSCASPRRRRSTLETASVCWASERSSSFTFSSSCTRDFTFQFVDCCDASRTCSLCSSTRKYLSSWRTYQVFELVEWSKTRNSERSKILVCEIFLIEKIEKEIENWSIHSETWEIFYTVYLFYSSISKIFSTWRKIVCEKKN